jgi:hypothetical protein
VEAQEERSVTDRESLMETLRSTSGVLLGLRKAIALSGHLDALAEIDTLLAVAQTEADRRIAMARLTAGLTKK